MCLLGNPLETNRTSTGNPQKSCTPISVQNELIKLWIIFYWLSLPPISTTHRGHCLEESLCVQRTALPEIVARARGLGKSPSVLLVVIPQGSSSRAKSGALVVIAQGNSNKAKSGADRQ